MLPSKGYFHDIECPYYGSTCGRPYCHYRHRKKNQDENLIEDQPVSAVPTYKPTPKSELANSRSHIPISYVPDLAFRSERPNRTIPKFSFQTSATYKPTPISVLANSNSKDDAVNEIKKNISEIEYNPTSDSIPNVCYNPTALNDDKINENLLKHEYRPTADKVVDFEYNPTSLKNIKDHNSYDNAYQPTGNDNTEKYGYKPTPVSDNPNSDFETNKEKYAYKPTPVSNNTNIDFETLNTEFELIDEIINDSTEKSHKPENILSKQKESVSKGHEKVNSSVKKIESSKSKDSKTNKHKEKSSKKSSSSSKKDKTEKTHHRKDEKKHESRESEKKKHEHSKSHKSKEKDKSKDRHKSENSKSKQKEDKHRERRDKRKNSSSSSSSTKTKHKEDKHQENIKDKKKHKQNSSRRKDEVKIKTETKHKNSSKDSFSRKEDEEEHNMTEIKMKYSLDDLDDSYVDQMLDADDYNLDIDLDDEDETMRECYRIFNEYKPPETKRSESPPNITLQEHTIDDDMSASSKKRIAHPNAIVPTTSKVQRPKLKSNLQPSLGQTLSDRFKIAKAMQEEKQQQNMMEEIIKEVAKRPAPPSAPSLLQAAKKLKDKNSKPRIKPPSTSLIDDILNESSKKTIVAKRIAPVPNVMNIQRAKAQLVELNKQRAAAALSKTPAQTLKGAKRQAHVPEYNLSDIPDVLEANKSKLPVNVRTRFLTMIAEECGKLYIAKNDAYQRALGEEYACYQKCKVLITYRNSAMLAVNRLRKEIQERDQTGLGMIGAGETSTKQKGSQFKGRKFYEHIKRYVLSDEELDIHGYPKESAIPGRAVIKNRKSSPFSLPDYQKKCSRCSKIYLVDDDGFPIYEEECIYHPLKKRTIRGEQMYLCCRLSDGTGCVTSNTHVSEMSEEAELEGYQTTMPAEGTDDPRSYAVYALDCEMCYTTRGLELTRVTIIDSECKVVYESLVKPLNQIIDYNTTFSGITQEHMSRTSTGILQVQANILHLCNSETILIGHSLESDLKALKIVHATVIDTAVLFPHRMGLPHKRALRALANEHLKKIIQNDVNGHDSAEDAVTCMELVLLKTKEDLKVKGGAT